MVLVRGRRPLLVDTGYGSDFDDTVRLLRDSGVEPERLRLVVNTHYHCDHVGGNHGLQRDFGRRIAAHRWDAALVARRHPELACAEWLDQPIAPYRVDRPLDDGDEIDCGEVTLRVLHLPGHTQGQIALYDPESRTLIGGDALMRHDVGWLNRFREGQCCLYQALDSNERLAELRIDRVYPGHGPPIDDPEAALDQTRLRYESWLDEPEKEAWHACKRMFAYALMLRDGLPEAELRPYLLARGWFRDFSRWVFGMEPADFVDPLIESMARGVEWRDGRLIPKVPYTAAPADWKPPSRWPRDWPRDGTSQ